MAMFLVNKNITITDAIKSFSSLEFLVNQVTITNVIKSLASLAGAELVRNSKLFNFVSLPEKIRFCIYRGLIRRV